MTPQVAGLLLFDRARAALAEAYAVDEVKDIRDQAAALQAYYRQRDGSLEMANQCAEIKIRAERRLGELLAEQVTRSHVESSDMSTRLPEGISRDQSSDWQAIARIPEPAFEAHIAETKEAGLPLTTAGVLRIPHVSHNSGNNEWYTPADYIEAARWVLGAIELDPASSAQANEVVQAERFYALEDDGLSQEWRGHVWLNPPYATDLINQFADKLIAHVDTKDVPAAVVLVNNATETAWFRQLVSRANAICFPSSRIKFWSADGAVGAPLQGQAVLYFGTDRDAFIEAFKPFGWLCIPQESEA